MADQYVREVGHLYDYDGLHITTGVYYEKPSPSPSVASTAHLTAEGAATLVRDLMQAAFEAGDHAGRLASQL